MFGKLKRAFAPLVAGILISVPGLAEFPAPAAADTALTWAAPVLNNPAVIQAAPGNQTLNLLAGRDYIVQITQPLTDAGGLVISGGHNVVLVGGEIRVPSGVAATQQRGLYLKAQTGTVHVEGLRITGDELAEGINLDERLGATVQLQNIAIDTVHGTQSGNHADLIQTWAGPKTLRIDGLTGRTTYQGMFLLPHQLFPEAQVTGWDFRNIDITGSPESGYALWKEDNMSITTSNVYVHKENGSTAKAFWPNAGAWPGATNGTPSSSVINITPGVGYVSPTPISAAAPVPTTTAPPTSVPATTVPPTTSVPTTVPTTTVPVVTPVPVNTPAKVTNSTGTGYWMVASDGGIFAFGDAGFHGSTGGMKLNQPIVGMAATSTGKGYWLVASDGGIFAFGDAKFYGSTGAIKLNQSIVGMAATGSGNGYWLVASDGGIFAFGDAAFHGSTGAIKLNQPIVGMTATASGRGYWLVARDGGIFAFGDAAFYGSTGAIKLNEPIVGMSATAGGKGYWLVAADGGIFAFGDAKFFGSASGQARGRVTDIEISNSGNGYTIHSAAGWVGAYGDATHRGDLSSRLNAPIVSAASL